MFRLVYHEAVVLRTAINIENTRAPLYVNRPGKKFDSASVVEHNSTGVLPTKLASIRE
jgi:hypothetical protein